MIATDKILAICFPPAKRKLERLSCIDFPIRGLRVWYCTSEHRSIARSDTFSGTVARSDAPSGCAPFLRTQSNSKSKAAKRSGAWPVVAALLQELCTCFMVKFHSAAWSLLAQLSSAVELSRFMRHWTNSERILSKAHSTWLSLDSEWIKYSISAERPILEHR